MLQIEINNSYGINVEKNKVLKNTYLLLALSMLPTALGAWIGIETGVLKAIGTIGTLMMFLIVSFGAMFLIQKNKDNISGVGILLGFTFFMGIMLSNLLGFVLGKSNGAQLVMVAFGGTALVLTGMASLASVVKFDLSSMSKYLFVGMIALLVAGIVNVFLQSSMLMVVLSVIAIGVFSLYILYDVKQIIDGGETNYVMATLGLYLSVYNIFANLLQLLGFFGGDD